MSELLDRYFAATSQAEVDLAEAALAAASRGLVTSGSTIVARGRDSVATWYGAVAAVPGGLACPRLFGDPSRAWDERDAFAHLELATPIPHPGGGVTRLVPVLPLRERMPVRADGVLGESPADILYRSLVRASRVLALHHERHGALDDAEGFSPHAHLAKEYAAGAGRTLAAIARCRASHAWPASRTWSAWSDGEALPPAPLEPPAQPAPYEPAAVHLFRVFDDGTGLVAFVRAIVRFRARDGKILGVVPCAGEVIGAPSPRLALVKAFAPTGRMMDETDHGPDVPETRERVFALDPASGRWLARPDEPAPVWFEEAMERSLLRDTDDRTITLDVPDYPVIHELTPDHRFAWVEDKEGSGGVFRLRDGALVVPFPQAADEWRDVPHLDARGKVVSRARYRPTQRHIADAIARVDDRWRTLRGGVVCDDAVPRLTLAGGSKLATFGDDGRLWIADSAEVLAIELGAGDARIRHRWSYPPLRTAAGAPARRRSQRL